MASTNTVLTVMLLVGIVLSWNMNFTDDHTDIANYQLFAYQEQPGPVSPSLWKKVGPSAMLSTN